VPMSVLIVDDHEAFRHSARRLLAADGLSVVGEAATGADALNLAEQLQPALVLVDIHLPDMDGFEVAERLAASAPRAVIVLISSRESGFYEARLTTSAARAFIPKSDLSVERLRQMMQMPP